MSKTVLKVISVLLIISGIITTVIGAGLAAGLHENAALTVLVIIQTVGGIFNIFAGVFGLRAAKEPSRSTPALVLGVLSFFGALAAVCMAFNLQAICGLVIPAVYFFSVLSVRKNA